MITLQQIEQRIPLAERAPFIAKAKGIAARLGVTYFALMAAMDFESGHTMQADIMNFLGYVGLIQFGAAAAKDLGTTTAALRAMTRLQQLDYVEAYFKLWTKRLGIAKPKDFTDLYLMIFYPAGVKVTDYNQDFTTAAVEKVNPALAGPDGHITKNSIRTNYSAIYGSDLFTPVNTISTITVLGFFLQYIT